nr:ribonuclease H-like domain-containing protein [Tanacetum cinerariifolium]
PRQKIITKEYTIPVSRMTGDKTSSPISIYKSGKLTSGGHMKLRTMVNTPSNIAQYALQSMKIWITRVMHRTIIVLHGEFAITDLGSLNYFLGISTQRTKSGLFLSQSKLAEKILKRAHMQHCNPCKTPVDTESKLGSDGDTVSDPTLYRSLV